MSQVMIVGGNPEARVGTGLGLLPGVVVDQHFQNRGRLRRLLGVLGKKECRECLGLGIDEETAAIVRGGRLTVLGTAQVSICRPGSGKEPPSVRVLKAGQEADLSELTRPTVARSPLSAPAPRKGVDAPPKQALLSD
jgi:cyanophycinase